MLLRALADRIAEVTFEALPRAAVATAKEGILDTVGVTLAGGDTAESPNGILADIVVLGSVPRGKAILRSGAQPGDRVYVSGQLGGSAAALRRSWAP